MFSITKKVLVNLIFIVFFIINGNVSAYEHGKLYNSPVFTNTSGWQDNLYFTHQSWEFNSTNNPIGHTFTNQTATNNGDDNSWDPVPEGPNFLFPGLTPDAVTNIKAAVNNYGTPLLVYAREYKNDPGTSMWSWCAMGGPWERFGYYGGHNHFPECGDDKMQKIFFEIPCDNISDLVKRVWIQFVIYIEKNGTLGQDSAWQVSLGRNYTPGDCNISNTNGIVMINETCETNVGGGGGTGYWHRVEQVWQFNDNPGMIYMSLKALGAETFVTLYDAVDIETASVVPVPPELAWEGDAGFESDGVNLNTNNSSMPFEFRVKYTSELDMNFPSIKQVWIDINDNNSYDEDEKFDMDEYDPADLDVTDSKDYTKTIEVFYKGDGIINYRFYFKDMIGQIAANTIPDGPTNTHTFKVNPVPYLRWMNTDGFITNGVEPDSALGGNSFEFQINYFDPINNQAPTTNQIWIDINNSGDYEGNEKFDMIKIDTGDTSYTNGCAYKKSIVLDYKGDGKIHYKFYFKTIDILVIGSPTTNHIVNILSNPPVLLWLGTGDFIGKGVDKILGKDGDKFEFQVRYMDKENEFPLTKQLWIDLNDNGNYNDSGEKLNMEEIDTGDADYTDGKDYRKVLTIHHTGDGKFRYRFNFNDGISDAVGEPAADQILTLLWESLNNVIAGPNPFKPNSSGGGDTITFNKLPEGTEIKVYTVSGKLAAALKEKDNNGKLEWKVVNDNGKTLASGMYLCHIKTTQGESKVIKIMVIR